MPNGVPSGAGYDRCKVTSPVIDVQTLDSEVSKIMASGASLLEALIEWASKRNIDLETVGTLVRKSPKLKGALQIEGEDLRMLKTRTARLPI